MAVRNPQCLLDQPVECHAMARQPGVVLPCVVGALLSRGRRGKSREVIPGQVQVAVRIATHQSQVKMLGDVQTEFGRARDVVVTVVVAFPVWREQVQRRDWCGPGMEMFYVGDVVKDACGTAETRRLVEGIERAALGGYADPWGAIATLRNDVDDTANGIRSVQPALRASQNFDPLDVRREKLAEIK